MNKNSQNPTEQVQAGTVQAQQEPVAWMYEWNGRTYITTADQRPIEHAHPHFNKSKPLYAAPQPPAQSCCTCTKPDDLQKVPTPAQQKPVAWIDVKPNPFDPSCRGAASVQDHALPPGEHKLYATPQPPVQQEPVAWRVRPFNYGIGHEGVDALTTRKEQCEMWQRKGWKVEQLYAVPQPTENLRCKSTQKRLATLWGYVKKEPDHFRDAMQIVSISQMLEVLRTKYSDLIYESNQKMAVHFEEDIFTINDFLQRIQQEAAEKARQPLTDEQMYSLYCEAMKGYYVSALHYWRNEEAHKFARAIEEAHGIGSTHG